jgi:hypothetical protein
MLGVSAAMKAWGGVLLRRYRKDAAATRAADVTLSTVGYSTDKHLCIA